MSEKIQVNNKTAFYRSWGFYDDETSYPETQDLKNGTATIPDQLFSDLRKVLEILERTELLFPRTIRLEEEVSVDASDAAMFCDRIIHLISQNPQALSVDKIGGEGIVYLPDGSREVVENLITLEDIRFCDRQFQIKTNFSVWLPLSMNLDVPQQWQPEMAVQNALRLEKALEEIQSAFQMEVEPGAEEIEKDEFIWIKGFTLYLDPEYLQDMHRQSPGLTAGQLDFFTLKP